MHEDRHDKMFKFCTSLLTAHANDYHFMIQHRKSFVEDASLFFQIADYTSGKKIHAHFVETS